MFASRGLLLTWTTGARKAPRSAHFHLQTWSLCNAIRGSRIVIGRRLGGRRLVRQHECIAARFEARDAWKLFNDIRDSRIATSAAIAMLTDVVCGPGIADNLALGPESPHDRPTSIIRLGSYQRYTWFTYSHKATMFDSEAADCTAAESVAARFVARDARDANKRWPTSMAPGFFSSCGDRLRSLGEQRPDRSNVRRAGPEHECVSVDSEFHPWHAIARASATAARRLRPRRRPRLPPLASPEVHFAPFLPGTEKSRQILL